MISDLQTKHFHCCKKCKICSSCLHFWSTSNHSHEY